MPKIKHTIILWARETSKLSIEDAAKKLRLTDTKTTSAVEKLIAYESGDKEPSRSLLLRMSTLYRQPLLVFYLDKPPIIGDRGEDFRTLPDGLGNEDNANIDVHIRGIKARQSIIRETLIDEDEGSPLRFINKCTLEQGEAMVVQTIRESLDFNLDEYRDRPNSREAFKFLRQQVESSGVFVLLQGNLGSHHSNIEVRAFRGFALADDIAPFIVINNNDSKAAWSFTLLHEMAHLILGRTGISGIDAVSRVKKIEKFCNNVASELLLPADEFNTVQFPCNDFEALKNKIHEYSLEKKISSSHVAYRLFRRGDINRSSWENLSNHFREKWLDARSKEKESNRKKEGGPNYYTTKRYSLGSLIELVQRMPYSGALTTTKAGMLLDVRPLKVHKLFC